MHTQQPQIRLQPDLLKGNAAHVWYGRPSFKCASKSALSIYIIRAGLICFYCLLLLSSCLYTNTSTVKYICLKWKVTS